MPWKRQSALEDYADDDEDETPYIKKGPVVKKAPMSTKGAQKIVKFNAGVESDIERETYEPQSENPIEAYM